MEDKPNDKPGHVPSDVIELIIAIDMNPKNPGTPVNAKVGMDKVGEDSAASHLMGMEGGKGGVCPHCGKSMDEKPEHEEQPKPSPFDRARQHQPEPDDRGSFRFPPKSEHQGFGGFHPRPEEDDDNDFEKKKGGFHHGF